MFARLLWLVGLVFSTAATLEASGHTPLTADAFSVGLGYAIAIFQAGGNMPNMLKEYWEAWADGKVNK